jgi:hypothetical protein
LGATPQTKIPCSHVATERQTEQIYRARQCDSRQEEHAAPGRWVSRIWHYSTEAAGRGAGDNNDDSMATIADAARMRRRHSVTSDSYMPPRSAVRRQEPRPRHSVIRTTARRFCGQMRACAAAGRTRSQMRRADAQVAALVQVAQSREPKVLVEPALTSGIGKRGTRSFDASGSPCQSTSHVAAETVDSAPRKRCADARARVDIKCATVENSAADVAMRGG